MLWWLVHVAFYYGLGYWLDGPLPARTKEWSEVRVMLNVFVVDGFLWAFWSSDTLWPTATLGEGALEAVVVSQVQEVLFYVFHRCCHWPCLYRWFHRFHHEWEETHALAALDAHPVEHVLVNVVPMMVGPWLFGWSRVATMVWLGVGLVSVLNGHSRHQPEDQFHRLHHRFRQFNFGTWFWLDYLCGTFLRRSESPR